MGYESDGHWHLSKAVPIVTILSIMGAVITGSIAVGEQEQKLKNVVHTQASILKKIDRVSDNNAKKAEVNQMFENRDIKIIGITEDVREIKQVQKEYQTEQRIAQKENQKMLQEILRKLPRD